MILIRWPMPVEVIEEGRPVEGKNVRLEILPEGMKTRDRYRPVSFPFRQAVQRAIRRCPVVFNICVGSAVEELRQAERFDLAR